LATVTLIVSLIFTILLVGFFYSPNGVGFTMVGLAALFLGISAAFSLRERGMWRSYGNNESGKSRTKKLDGKQTKNRKR
jgi:hypothetical protein